MSLPNDPTPLRDAGGDPGPEAAAQSALARRALQWLAALLDHLLRQQPQGRSRLRAHAGKSLQLHAGGWRLPFEVGEDGSLRSVPVQQHPALRLDVDVAQWMQAQWRGGAGAALAGVRIAGDAEFAQVVSGLLGSLRGDAEADLARLFGDLLAHRAVRAARGAAAGARGLGTRLLGDTRDWLREDARGLVGRQEVDALAADVARLRDATARLDKRLAMLRRRLGS